MPRPYVGQRRPGDERLRRAPGRPSFDRVGGTLSPLNLAQQQSRRRRAVPRRVAPVGVAGRADELRCEQLGKVGRDARK